MGVTETEHLSLEDSKGGDEMKDDTPEEDASVEWPEEQEEEEDSGGCTTERKTLSQTGHFVCLRVSFWRKYLRKQRAYTKCQSSAPSPAGWQWYSLPPEKVNFT